jgi:hypothetical protein
VAGPASRLPRGSDRDHGPSPCPSSCACRARSRVIAYSQATTVLQQIEVGISFIVVAASCSDWAQLLAAAGPTGFIVQSSEWNENWTRSFPACVRLQSTANRSPSDVRRAEGNWKICSQLQTVAQPRNPRRGTQQRRDHPLVHSLLVS